MVAPTNLKQWASSILLIASDSAAFAGSCVDTCHWFTFGLPPTICHGLLFKLRADGKSYAEQITYVTDRAGHDRRYAIDASKIEKELGWRGL